MKYVLLVVLALAAAGFSPPEKDSLSILTGKPTGDYGHIYFALGSSSVSAGNYTAVVSSLTTAAQKMEIISTSSSPLYFAIGAQSSETMKFLVMPGPQTVFLNVPASSRISVKAFSTGETINVGRMFINFFTFADN